jgi:tetraacyldisaccharide 4'-kinase
MKQALIDKIRRGESLPPLVGATLCAAEPLTRLGMWWRLRQPRTRVAARVISFGNITAGGVGKTPAVIERTRAELAQGRRVAVLTRGYGARRTPEPVWVEGDVTADDVQSLGEEAALILRRVPRVAVVKAADRVAGAQTALEHGCDTLILDDGFQFVMLERDENVVVIDASNPFGNGHLLPRGILREPLDALARATHVVLTRCDQAKDVDAVEQQVRAWLPEAPVRKTRHAPTRLWRVNDGQETPLETLRGQRIAAVCAIGHPEAFFKTLESLGAVISERHVYPDHATIPVDRLPASALVITTEKDAIRMHEPAESVYALGIDLQDC